jgi:cytochrome oxidase Cu insertion factor (SCO1/SenC/PrrC family)
VVVLGDDDGNDAGVSVDDLPVAPPDLSVPPRGRNRRIAIVVVVLWLLVLVAGGFAYVVVRTHPAPTGATSVAGELRITGLPSTVSSSLANMMGLSPVPAKDAPGFTLADQNGRTFSLSDFKGRSVVLEFMDPHCTDICPLVSQEFLDAQRDLGPSASNVVFVAINVNQYFAGKADVAAFSQAHLLSTIPSWHFFTGPLKTLQAAWRDYGIVVTATSRTADIVHTDTVFFIDPNGQERFVAEPVADYTSTGSAYLPTADLAAWGKGIALIARAMS